MVEKKRLLITLIIVVGLFVSLSSREKTYVVVAIDTEQDIVPFFDSYLGITEGLPKILEILSENKIKATFFITGDVALKYPEIIEEIVREGHDIGNHGLMHERFTELNYSEKERVIEESTKILEEVSKTEIISFRSPYQVTEQSLVRILDEEGYCIEATFDDSNNLRRIENSNLIRLTSKPLFYPSTNYPKSWIDVYEETILNQRERKIKVVAVNLHSWNMVNFPEKEGIEEYTRASGNYTLNNFKQLLNYLKDKNLKFVTAREICLLFKLQK